MGDPVRGQYEDLPYPPRDPADEARRLITGSPSHLAEIEHYVCGGWIDPARPFRALMAGGGTGDATIMLAQQLADRGQPAEIAYLDLSAASRAICEARAARRGLTNIRFHSGSLLDLPGMGLGPFDYIDCCGVLHHLADPEAGLKALTAVLAPMGGLGLMVYGTLGRIGVYHAQDMLRLLAPDAGTTAARRTRLDLARKLLAELPPTNWLKRNPFVADHLTLGDPGLYDLLLHAQDRAYRVPEILGLVTRAGLAVASFIEPARYDPATYTRAPALLKTLAPLSPAERATFAELFAGNMKTHTLYALRPDALAAVRVDPTRPDAVPVLRDFDGATFAKGWRAGALLAATFDGIPVRFTLPDLGGPIIARIDGHRSLTDIHAACRQAMPNLDWPAFARAFAALYQPMNGLNKLLIRYRRVLTK